MRSGLLKAMLVGGLVFGAGTLIGCDEDEIEEFMDGLHDVAEDVDIDVHDDYYHDHDDGWWVDGGVWWE